MDKRVQQLVDDFTVKFGLEHYQLETYSFHKESMYNGEVHYKCNLTFFPHATADEGDEDFNPDGTAIIEYNLTTEKLIHLLFVNGQSFSTKTVFETQTVKEVANWIEQETGYRYENDFTVVDTLSNGYKFEAEMNGLPSSPGGVIEVEFDQEGKLTSFLMRHMPTNNEMIKQETFTLSVDKIATLIEERTKLVEFPNEDEQKYILIYGIDNVYIRNDNQHLIPYFIHEREEIVVNEPVSWSTAGEGTIERNVVELNAVVSIEEAFTQNETSTKSAIGDNQIQEITSTVTDVLRTVLPNDSNKWTLATVRQDQHFIEVVCTLDATEQAFFNRKFIVLLDSISLTVLNYMDNEELLEIFNSFTPAPEAKISRKDAVQKLTPFVTLTPTYVYDYESKQFVLCGLLNATHAVDAVSGEMIPLEEA